MKNLISILMLVTLMCVSSADLYSQFGRSKYKPKYKSKVGYRKTVKRKTPKRKPTSQKAGPNSAYNKKNQKKMKPIKKHGPKLKAHYVTIGGSLGALNYKGDFEQSKSLLSSNLKGTRPGLGVNITERMGQHLSLRAELFYGRIKGDDADAKVNNRNDAYRRLRNLNFVNNILEFKFDVIYDIIPARSPIFMKRTIFTPYVFAGIAVFTNDPRRNGESLRKIGTVGQHLSDSDKEKLEDFYASVASDYDFDPKIPDPYKQIQIAVPFGIGVRQRLTTHIDLSFEVGVRYTFTDYLDDLGDRTVFIGRNDDLTSGLNLEGDLSTLYDFNDGYTSDLLSDLDEEYSNIDPDQSYNTGQIKGGSRTNFLSKRDFYIFTGFKLSYVIGKATVSSKF